jgi:hypothetical protein
MNIANLRARGFSILSVTITILLLFGISCSGGSATSEVSKSVVNTEPCTIVGLVWYDADNDEDMDPNEFGVPGIEVMFYEYGEEQTQYTDETDAVGVYQIVIPGTRDHNMTGRIQPTEYGEDFDAYDPNGKEFTVYEADEFEYGPPFRGYNS